MPAATDGTVAMYRVRVCEGQQWRPMCRPIRGLCERATPQASTRVPASCLVFGFGFRISDFAPELTVRDGALEIGV